MMRGGKTSSVACFEDSCFEDLAFGGAGPQTQHQRPGTKTTIASLGRPVAAELIILPQARGAPSLALSQPDAGIRLD